MRDLRLIALACLAAVAGCSDDDATPVDGGEEADAGVDAAPPTITFSVTIMDALEEEPTVVPDVEVCAAEREDVPCATSDAEGKVTMELPANSELMLRCEGPDHGPMYMTWTIGEEDIDAGTFSLIDSTRLPFVISLSGGSEWPEKGAILVNAFDELVERDTYVGGATYVIAPVSGGGPTYVSEGQLPDPDLTESTAGGPAVFYDLDDGDVTVTISHGDRQCRGGFGWHTDDETELRSRIFPGGLSSITFVCPAP